MSSVVSGITKIFSAVGTGVAATLGTAVKALGGAFATVGAATGTGASAGTGFFSNLFGSGSTLANMFEGVGNVLGLGGTTAAAPTTGFGKLVEGATNFAKSDLGIGVLQGLGAYASAEMQADANKDLLNTKLTADANAVKKIQDSYSVPNSALVGGQTQTASTTQDATSDAAKTRRAEKTVWYYDDTLKKIIQVPAKSITSATAMA